MSTYTMVRAMVPADVAQAALDKAQTDGHTLAEVVAELLANYTSSSEPKPAKPAPARKRK